MDDLRSELEKYLKVKEILTDLLESTDWSGGAVLKVSEKKIKSMRDELAGSIKGLEHQIGQEEELKPIEPEEDEVAAFVVVYLSRGVSLENWYQRIVSLPKHSIGLPVFPSEKEAKKYMRSKPNMDNHGVVEVLVKKNLVSAEDDMILLQGGAIRLERIRSFDDGRSAYWFFPKKPLTKIESR